MNRPAAPRVLHVSGDFPDPIAPGKTQAVRRLIDLTGDRFRHRVLSLNRRSPAPGDLAGWTGRRLAVDPSDFAYGIAATYRAPPRGLFHRRALEELGDWLADRVLTGGEPRPDLLVAHKLTIEGIAVSHAAQQLGLPYALTIQGNTDTRILRARPDLAPLLRRVLHGAAAVFPFTPWAWGAVIARLGAPPAAPRLLPCATDLDAPLTPRTGGDGFVSVFHLAGWHTKNFDRTLAALARLDGAARLAVIGGGSGPAADRCRALGRHAPGVRFEGAADHAALPARLNAATALVMPSRRESFGMAFIEALFAGLPIIYPAGQGVDGYFDGAPFALRVDARSPAAIAAAMRHAIAHEAEMKTALARWQTSADAARFRRPAIARQFAAGLAEALGG